MRIAAPQAPWEKHKIHQAKNRLGYEGRMTNWLVWHSSLYSKYRELFLGKRKHREFVFAPASSQKSLFCHYPKDLPS